MNDVMDISGLNDLPVLVLSYRDRPSISEATRLLGNYAYFPDIGWRRYWTLADQTWFQYGF